MAVRSDLAVIAFAIAGAVLWIEHGHRVDIETPVGAALVASAGAVCPESENVPYSADCIVFMQGDGAPDLRGKVNVESAPAALVHAPGIPESSGPACPANNENVPYSAKCLRFLSGWFWQANAPVLR